MFETGFKVFVIACLSVLALALFIRQPEKLAYVDAVKLMNKYKGMEDARIQLEQKAAIWQSRMDTLRYEAEEALHAYEKKRTRESEAAMRFKQEQYASYQQIAAEQYKKDEKELLDGVLAQVNERIKQYAKENGYRIVLSGTQLGTIAYADEALDITDDLITIINKEYSGK